MQWSFLSARDFLVSDEKFPACSAVYYIRSFLIVRQPISNKPTVFPMMTLSSNLHPAYLQKNIDKN
jgi:hypothetical protein